MELGRRAVLDGVRWSLPALAADPVGPPAEPRVWLGLSVWTLGLDTWYPAGLAPGDRLAHYAGHFSAIELNASFHAVPTAARMRAWADATPVSFRFSTKIPKEVSHPGGSWVAAAAGTRAAVEGLGHRAGPGFFQAPPEVVPEDEGALLERLDALGPAVGAVELRHPAWWPAGRPRPSLDHALRSRGLGVCLTDTPGRRDLLHGGLTAPSLIVRFLAVHGHPSTEARLRLWVDRLPALGALGVRDLWFFVHEPDQKGLVELEAGARAAFGAAAVPRPGGPPRPRQVGLFGAGAARGG